MPEKILEFNGATDLKEEEAMNQKNVHRLDGKGKETDSLLELPEGTQLC